MLFKGIPAEQLGAWEDATIRSKANISFWREVVGLESVERWNDPTLFRVLEWGGMEIRK